MESSTASSRLQSGSATDVEVSDETLIPIGWVPRSDLPIVLVAVLGSICWMLVALRVFTRSVILKRLGWDDYTMIITLLFFSAYATGFLGTHLIVTGRSSLSLKKWELSLNFLLVSEHFYTLTMLVLKISLALFFLRTLVKRWQKILIYAAATISSIFGALYFFFSVFQCGTFSSILEFGLKRISSTECVTPTSAVAMGYAHAMISVVTDFIFVLLPMIALTGTNMGKREKVTVMFILSLGAVGSVASIIRLRYIPVLGSPGVTFYSAALGLGSWSLIELALGIMAASLASLRPLVRKFLNPVRATIQSRCSSAASRRLRKTRYSNGSSINKSSISKPYDVASNSSRTWLCNSADRTQPSATTPGADWDKATLIESPDWENRSTRDELGVLSPLPKITPFRPQRGGDVVRTYEMTALGGERRNSCPTL